METKKAKVTKLTKKDKDSYGKFSFVLEFENGDKGFYSTPNGDQTHFIAGNVADYMIEAKTSKAGSQYFVITHPEDSAKSGGSARPKVDPKVQIVGFAARYAKDLAVAGKIEPRDLESYFERFHKMMSSKL